MGEIVMCRWTATLGDKQISVTQSQLEEFRLSLPIDGQFETRVSQQLWFDLFVMMNWWSVSPFGVLDAIRNLEEGEPSNGIKRATQFRKAPLKGLWHKHYFDPQFVSHNLSAGWGPDGLERTIREVIDPAKSERVTREMVNDLAYRLTTGHIEKRASSGKLTGEWLIFARANGQNYYLCVATHDSGDHNIYDRIMQHCIHDFPELPRWLS